MEVLLCDRMGVSYPELVSDEMPAQIVEDYMLVMVEEARQQRERQAEMERQRRG